MRRPVFYCAEIRVLDKSVENEVIKKHFYTGVPNMSSPIVFVIRHKKRLPHLRQPLENRINE